MSDLQGTFHPLTPPQMPGPLGEPQDFGGGLFAFYFEEEVTLSVLAASTTTNITLPVGSLVTQVTARVTTTVATCTDWAIGVETETSKFITAQTTLTAGFTVTANKAFDPSLGSLALGPITGAHNVIRVLTTGAQTTAGKIRIGVSGFYMKPFTS